MRRLPGNPLRFNSCQRGLGVAGTFGSVVFAGVAKEKNSMGR